MSRFYRLHFVTCEYAGITHPYTAGLGNWIADFAPALSNYGHEVTVLTGDPIVSQVAQTPQGVTVHRVAMQRRGTGAAEALVKDFAWQRLVREWLLTQAPADVVIVPEYGGAAAAFADTSRRPVLVTQLHSSAEQVRAHSPGGRHGVRSALPEWLNHRREVRQARQSDAIVGTSTAVLNDTLQRWKLHPPFTGIIPNILNIARVRTLAAGSPPSLPNGRRVLFVGRLDTVKGTHILADAMRSVFARHPDVYLILAGADRPWRRGSMSDYVRASAGIHAHRVVHYGELAPEALMPLIRACEVVALPSLWEACPFTVLEAMALGRPVVSTSGHGVDDFITTGDDGLLVPSNDAPALAEAINCLLDNDRLAGMLGAKAAKRAEQYGPEAGARRATQVFNEIVDMTKQ